jgi:hypothetical protein
LFDDDFWTGVGGRDVVDALGVLSVILVAIDRLRRRLRG